MTALVEDYPEDYQSLNNLAWVYATSKDSAHRDAEKAIDLAQQALVLAPMITIFGVPSQKPIMWLVNMKKPTAPFPPGYPCNHQRY